MENNYLNNINILKTELKEGSHLSKYEYDTDLIKNTGSVFHVGYSFSFVFDHCKLELKNVNPEVKKVLGFNSEDFSLDFYTSKIHPNDHSFILNAQLTIQNFYKSIPLERIPNYKPCFDYRILNSENKYIRMLHQSFVLEHDCSHNRLKILALMTDITHIKPIGDPSLSFIAFDGGWDSYFNVELVDNYKQTNNFFTCREMAIIEQLILGKNTHEIAQTLSISEHTVSTHRKNILIKANVKNTPELLNKILHEDLM